MEYSRTTSNTQPAQTGFSFEPAVGTLYSAANTIALSKDIGVFFSAAACKPTLFGRVVQAIAVTAFLHRAFMAKRTLAAPRGGHDRFCFAGLFVVN